MDTSENDSVKRKYRA